MRTFWLLVVAACGTAEPDVADNAIPFGLGGTYSCPPAYCGSNSATIDHFNFHELNLDGAWNAEGFRVLGMSAGGAFYNLDVTNSRIIGRGAFKNQISGAALAGAVIYLEHTSRTQYAVRIAGVSYVQEVVPPHGSLETYRFEWAVILNDQLPRPVRAGETLPIPGFDGPQDVCPFVEDKVEGTNEWNEAAVVPLAHALVYEGDRIDRDRRTVGPVPDRRWFNLTCGPDALAKLRLSRSTQYTNAKDWRLTQATLKMLSADYCGTGQSFTMTGEPLIWKSRSGMQLRGGARSFEARWDENGARCLDEPRARDTALSYLSTMFPKVDYAIEDECKLNHRVLQPCQNTDPTIFDPGDLVISANPY